MNEMKFTNISPGTDEMIAMHDQITSSTSGE